MADALKLDRLTTALVGICGLIALAMAIVGVYGAVGDAVQRRTREIGLRVALGASRTRVVAEAVKLNAAGVAAGVALALAIGYVARSAIPDLPSFDPVALASAAAALMLAMSIGIIPPMRHALAIQPNIALREE